MAEGRRVRRVFGVWCEWSEVAVHGRVAGVPAADVGALMGRPPKRRIVAGDEFEDWTVLETPTDGRVSGPDNVVVMSYLANRLKNDGTAAQHARIANWMREHGDVSVLEDTAGITAGLL